MRALPACLLLFVAGCPDPAATNPEKLWLAPDGQSEVKLVGSEPHPF